MTVRRQNVEQMHLGWDPEGRVCLGGGPVRLRFSREEAAELRDRIGELLGGAPDPCGCVRQQPVAVPADRFGF